MSKPSSTLAQQIRTLTGRGLTDPSGVLPRALMDHGYFRLSGYWRYFQLDPRAGRNDFVMGADFAQVLDVYEQDAETRNLLLEGLAQVEIALRTSLAAHMCVPGGTGSEYLDPATYVADAGPKGLFRDLLIADIKSDIARSKEWHVAHYRDRAGSVVPLWVAVEALSFGVISRMYGLLANHAVRDAVAGRFGYPTSGLFKTNIRAVSVFRNVCAHHSRVWNRTVRQDVPRIFPGLIEKGLREADYRNTPWGSIEVVAGLVGEVRRDDTFRKQLVKSIDRTGAYWYGLTHPRDT